MKKRPGLAHFKKTDKGRGDTRLSSGEHALLLLQRDQVQMPLKATVLSVQMLFEKNQNKQKGYVWTIKSKTHPRTS